MHTRANIYARMNMKGMQQTQHTCVEFNQLINQSSNLEEQGNLQEVLSVNSKYGKKFLVNSFNLKMKIKFCFFVCRHSKVSGV